MWTEVNMPDKFLCSSVFILYKLITILIIGIATINELFEPKLHACFMEPALAERFFWKQCFVIKG